MSIFKELYNYRELLKTNGSMKMVDKYFNNIGQIPESLF